MYYKNRYNAGYDDRVEPLTYPAFLCSLFHEPTSVRQSK